jgi:hypothetical protein
MLVLLVMMGVGFAGFYYGRVAKLFTPFSTDGQLCEKTHPLAFYYNLHKISVVNTATSDEIYYSVCVSQCPKQNDVSTCILTTGMTVCPSA